MPLYKHNGDVAHSTSSRWLQALYARDGVPLVAALLRAKISSDSLYNMSAQGYIISEQWKG